MDSCQGSHKFTTLHCLRRVNIMHVRILFANPSHNANSVTEFDFLWRANANANFVLLILRSSTSQHTTNTHVSNGNCSQAAVSDFAFTTGTAGIPGILQYYYKYKCNTYLILTEYEVNIV